MPAGTLAAILAAAGSVFLHGRMAVVESTHVGMLGAPAFVASSFLFWILLWFGHPLARQWARAYSVLIAAWVPLVPGFQADPLPFLAGVGLAWMVFYGLGTRASRRYFGLHCVMCDSYRMEARSFFFSRIGCKRCKRVWKRGEQRFDPAVFD